MAIINSQKVLGIVTEYNPFHNGHAHHIKVSKDLTQSDYVVAVMSSHFTQRGEPAIADPHTRAKWAIDSGVDLVISLPTLFSTASAGYFAYGAVYLLNALGIIDCLCFGSESGDIQYLENMQALINQTETEFKLAQIKTPSLSYQNHRDQLIKIQNQNGDLSRSNDILGLSYLDALSRLNSSIVPYTIQRIQSDYKSTSLSGAISSATAIRETVSKHLSSSFGLHSKDYTDNQLETIEVLKATMPLTVVDDLFFNKTAYCPPDQDLWHEWILFELRRSNLDQLASIHDMASGLEQRMKSKAIESASYPEFENELKTKIYTTGRLKRVMAKLMLGITKEDLTNDFATQPEYIHVLAFNDKGRQLLSHANTSLPIINNAKHFRPANELALRQWEIDCTASNLYHLLLKDQGRVGGNSYRKKPLYIK